MNTILKVIAGILVVCLMLLSTIFVFSTQTLNKNIEYTDASPPIPKDSASIERGRHLSRAISKCVECHSDD